MFCYVLQLLCDLSTRNQISKQLRTSLRSGFSVGQQVTTGDRGWTSRQSVWIYLMTSARLDATDQFPCQEPVDKKLAHNWSLCMKIVHQFNINYWLATYLIQYAQPVLQHSNEQMNAWPCCLRNITCNFQNSATQKCDYRTDWRTDRCQTKWSLCASLLPRRHKNLSCLRQVTIKASVYLPL